MNSFVFLNGQFVPEEQAVVSVFDRGFLYGDGLFESLRVYNSQPFRWTRHLERLQRGADFLKIRIPFTAAELRNHAAELIRRNQMPECLLRLVLSRGVGPRGYSPRGADHPVLVMSLHPAPAIDPKNPPRWRLITSSCRLPANEPLAQFKTCNKLQQVLARAEADAANAHEALLLNTDGKVAETSSGNVFWIEGNTVCTPPIASPILPGVTRAVVVEICQDLGVPTREAAVRPQELLRAQAVFLSLTSLGIVEAVSLDGQPLHQSPLVPQISAAYEKLTRTG